MTRAPAAMQLTELRSFAGTTYIIPARVQYDVVHEKKALEERTGAARASVPNNKKKEMYEVRRIAVFLSGVALMRVSAC